MLKNENSVFLWAHEFIFVIIYIIKKFIFFINFLLNFILGNTYKFYCEKKLQEIATNFFVKYFV